MRVCGSAILHRSFLYKQEPSYLTPLLTVLLLALSAGKGGFST